MSTWFGLEYLGGHAYRTSRSPPESFTWSQTYCTMARMPYELSTGTIPLSALQEAQAKGWAVCEGSVSVSSPVIVYNVESDSRRVVGICFDPADLSRVISASSSRRRIGGISHIARMLKVSRVSVHRWLKKYPDFPSPLPEAIYGPRTWDLSEVLDWNAHWRPYGRHLPKPVEATNY